MNIMFILCFFTICFHIYYRHSKNYFSPSTTLEMKVYDIWVKHFNKIQLNY